MTAIAYKDGFLAADTVESSEGLRLGVISKIARSMDGKHVGAAAGHGGACAEFNKWIVGNGVSDGHKSPMKFYSQCGGAVEVVELGQPFVREPYVTFQMLAESTKAPEPFMIPRGVGR